MSSIFLYPACSVTVTVPSPYFSFRHLAACMSVSPRMASLAASWSRRI